MKLKCFTIFICATSLLGCGAKPDTQSLASELATDSEKQASSIVSLQQPDIIALERELPKILKIADVPGLSIAVIENGVIMWTGAFGTVNDSTQSRLNNDTVFEAASMSKPVFGYIVLRLVGRGEFDLDQPLYELLENPRLIHDERYKRITARMVLTHSTGLPNWGGDTLAFQFDPGTGYSYSGEAFVYLQKVIEHITGKSLEELATREVFEPLGMTRTSFIWQNRFEGNSAYARDWLWNVGPITKSPEANAAASLLTTAADYAQFVAAVLNGTGLEPTLWKAFLTPARDTERGVQFGLGIGIEDGKSGRTFFHGGSNGQRFTSYMLGDLTTGDGFVFLSSSMDGITLVSALADRIFRKDLPRQDMSVYNRYNEAGWLGLKAVQRIALASGEEAATRKFRELRAEPDTRFPPKNALWLGNILTRLNFVQLGTEVIQTAVEDDPNSVSALFALGEAQESGNDFVSALETYRRALSLGDKNFGVRERIRWLEETLAMHASPVDVPIDTLERYVGRYGARKVTLRGDTLHYQRDGSIEHRLIPISQTLFALSGSQSFRIQFERHDQGPVEKIIGIYKDGGTDESIRSK